MAKQFAKGGVPDQMPHSVASDLGLHCLPVTLLRVSRLQCDNYAKYSDPGKIRTNPCDYLGM